MSAETYDENLKLCGRHKMSQDVESSNCLQKQSGMDISLN